MLKGHSGSKLEKHGNIVEKRSSYLANCEDLKKRGQFLVELSKKFLWAPRIIEVKADVMKYEYGEGQPGFEKVNLTDFGKIVRNLHALKIEAPEKETGIHWLQELGETNLQKEGIDFKLDEIVSKFEADPKVIVHGEITDVVVTSTGRIVILDWDESGLGTKYQDIGFVYFKCKEQRNGDKDFKKFLAGYDDPNLKQEKILKAAGLIAIAYSRFANKDFRLEFGLTILKKR